MAAGGKGTNQYFKETLNRLSTSIDLTNPNGLEMSAAFDKYIEKVIKPIYPKGERIRQTSAVDDAAGLRTVDWSFKSTNNKMAQAVQAAVGNFIQSWGAQRGLIDNQGNPVGGAGSIPMQVGNITPQIFNGTKTRILNTRTAASIAAASVRSGGYYAIDKNTGVSTWSVPDTALTPDGKNLSRSLRAEVREGDKRWLMGNVSLSSLAEGASPANTEERALALGNRNYRTMLAKYKAMTPEQERQETFMRMARAGRRYAAEKDYERQNPFDPRVQAKRQRQQKQNLSRSLATVKQSGKRVLGMARNAVLIAISSILSAIGVAVAFLGKINTSVADIGRDVRRQSMEDMRYNLAEGFTRQWERFAEKRGFNKELLSQAAGGIASAWSSPLNYSDSNFNALAPYLRESTTALVRQATASGDQNVLSIMSLVIDDLVSKSLAGEAGTKLYTGQSKASAAFTENMTALQGHNGAWAQLMQLYWRDLTDPNGKFKAAAASAGEEASFYTWLTQGYWHPEYVEKGNGMSGVVPKSAAERTYEAVESLKGSLNSLRTDTLERIAGSLVQVAEDVRSKIVNLLSRYFPAFALKEKERAAYLNVSALVNAENNLPGYRASAQAGLSATGFIGGLDEFKEIWEGILKRDSKVLAKLPSTVDFDALDAFVRYQAAPYYETLRVIERVNEENEKVKNGSSYVPTAIVYDADVNATRFTSLGMAANFGLQNMQVHHEAPSIKSGGNTLLQRIWAGGPLDNDPDRPIYDVLNFFGLQMLTDFMTGQQIGHITSSMTKDELDRFSLMRRIEGTYDRYKKFEAIANNYRNIAGNGVLPIGSNGRVLSAAQAEDMTRSFHTAEKDLYDYLAAMYDTEDTSRVLGAYDLLAGFYHNYGHFARVTDAKEAAKIRAQAHQNMTGTLLGDWLADATAVYSPDEVMSMLREKRAEYIRLHTVAGELSAYQRSMTLPLLAVKQDSTNDMTIPLSLVERTNKALLATPSLPDNLFDLFNLPGFERVSFDVDEEAIKNRTAAVTNVYIDISGRGRVKLLDAVNTGLPQDVHVMAGQDVTRALFEAFSAAR
jgi:hypothetical protein